MKPGSWLLSVFFNAAGDDTTSAVSRLRAYLYGDDEFRGENETAAPFLAPDSGFDAGTYQSKALGSMGIFVIQKNAN